MKVFLNNHGKKLLRLKLLNVSCLSGAWDTVLNFQKAYVKN